eukprot:g5448.t1
MLAKLDNPPTSFHELSFVDNIYKTKEELAETFTKHGYTLFSEITVPNVDCVLFVPIAFPQNRSEEAEFDFSTYSGTRLTIGVCIGGTRLTNGWDEKWKLGVQGVLKLNHNCACADKAATKIFMALDDFVREHRQLSQHDIKLDVFISGYSLGGLFAQVTTVLLQDWANTTRSQVTCRTYESPGVPEMYHEIARNYDDDAESYWKQRILNYKSLPNPLNTVFEDLGRVVHLKNIENISCDRSWVLKCVAGTTRRLVFWGGLLRGFGVSSIDGAFSTLSRLDQRLLIGASMAMSLGMDLCEIVRSHDVSLMAKSFNPQTGLVRSEVCLEMRQWPTYLTFQETAENMIKTISQGMVLMDPKNAGVHTLLLFGGKRGFVERKLAMMPGYLPMKQDLQKLNEVDSTVLDMVDSTALDEVESTVLDEDALSDELKNNNCLEQSIA